MTDRIAWLGQLAVDATLPERVVIVRNEAVAHSWRRDAIASERTSLLAGTRFVTVIGAATAVLADAALAIGEEAVRPARIAALLRDAALELPGFDMRVLRDRPGWDRALASAIGDLEGAGFEPALLPPSCAGLGQLWSRLDALAGRSWTLSRMLREASRLLVEAPSRWPYSGAVLAEVTGHETAVHAAFLRAVPNIELRYLRVRPLRIAHGERARAIFPNLRPLDPAPLVADPTERHLLATFLFASPEVLGQLERARSRGVDGTVQFEEHAGVEAELDAAVTWAQGELAAGTPAEQVAIVVPRLDPYAALLHHRFSALGDEAVHVIGGLPATASSSGARILTVLRSLADHLHLEAMVDLVPILKTTTETTVSRHDAIDLLYELGTIGGTPADPASATAWAVRRSQRASALARELAETTPDDDRGRERRRTQRLHDQLESLAPAFEALARVADLLVQNASLGTVWDALQSFLRSHVRVGGDGQRITTAIDGRLAAAIAAGLLAGEAALETLAVTLEALRIPVGRFGEPRITVVALGDSVGLTFDRVRIIGLSEGVVPPSTRDDAVLPDAVRKELGRQIRTSADRSLAALHALHRLVLATRERVVLSVSRVDVDRGYREPSGVLLEAAAALARPPLDATRVVPDARIMRHACYEPGRRALSLRAIGDAGRLTRAARTAEIPDAWRADVLRPLAIPPTTDVPTVMDGWLPSETAIDLPGATPEYPISASMLGVMLACPHRFLYERVLGWRAPDEVGEEDAIDALSYGILFHGIAEDFYRAHGKALCDREATVAHWCDMAIAIGDAHFAQFVERYPLVGEDVRTAQQARLRRDLVALLESDWEHPKSFFAVEQPFATALDVDGAPLHVHGYIDRIDRTAEQTLVRDLKTGRAKPRMKEDDLRPPYDVQLGLYGIVTQQQASAWGVSPSIAAAYVYPSDASGDERAFVDDFETLADATREWVGTAAGLLRARLFPRTPVEDDCKYCAFQPVCGPTAQVRAARLLDESPAVARFRTLKLGEDGPDDE